MPSTSNRWIVVPLLLAAAVSIGVLIFSELSHDRLFRAAGYARHSLQLQELTREIQTLVLEAETGQRGYLLSGRAEYLEPYTIATQKLDDRLARLRALIPPTSPEQLQRVEAITDLVSRRMSEIRMALTLHRERGPDAAQSLKQTDIGRKTMDALRAQMQAFDASEQAHAGALWTLWEQDVLYSRFGMALSSAFNVFLLVAVYLLASRDARLRAEADRQRLQHQQSLEDTVRDRTAELSRAYRHLQAVQEAEKSRLARDIHDELGAILVSAKMDTSWVQHHLQPQQALVGEKLQRVLEILDQGVQIKRRLIEELRPTLLDNLGLGAAIEWQAGEICARAGLTARIDLPEEEPVWPSEISIALFRIVQEALTNIVRYAQASEVRIRLTTPQDGVRLTVRDNGVGMSPRAASGVLSHGILGMRERVMGLGGVFRIDSPAEGGTVIEVFVPVVHGAAADSGSPAAAAIADG
jgi:signal transduction histidine kinase